MQNNKTKKKAKSIKFLISMGIAVMLIISNFTLLFLNNFFAKNSFSQQVKEDMLIITQQAARLIANDLHATEETVKTLATSWTVMQDKSNTEKADFYEKAATDLGFNEFIFADTQGNVVNLTHKAESGNITEREYFQRSVKGETYTSNILIDMVTNKKIIAISTPYYENGKIAGVFGGMKKVDFISNICADFKWQKSGIIAVYDKNSQIVGHTRKEVVDSDLNIVEDAKTNPDLHEVRDFFVNEVFRKDSGYKLQS